jgi:hypothetical protein
LANFPVAYCGLKIKALWQEFKAKQSHDEMAAGIAAMED